MNNLRVVILLAFGASLFSSCDKEYLCTCFDDNENPHVSVIAARSVRGAKKLCNSITLTPQGSSCIYSGEHEK